MPRKKISVRAFIDGLTPDEREDLIQEVSAMTGAAGGRARARRMTPAQRSEAARRAVNARWARHSA